MKLWVDDLRPPPDGTWSVAVSSEGALYQIQLWRGMDEQAITELALDHDLGGDDTTRPVVRWLCEHGWGEIETVRLVTANPVGRAWLEGMINRYGPGVTRD